MATRYRDWLWVPTSFQNKTYNVLIHESTLCRSHSSLYKEKTAKKWRNKALLRYHLCQYSCNNGNYTFCHGLFILVSMANILVAMITILVSMATILVSMIAILVAMAAILVSMITIIVLQLP